MKYFFMALLTLADAYAESSTFRLRAHVPAIYKISIDQNGDVRVTQNSRRKNSTLQTEKKIENNLLIVTVTQP